MFHFRFDLDENSASIDLHETGKDVEKTTTAKDDATIYDPSNCVKHIFCRGLTHIEI